MAHEEISPGLTSMSANIISVHMNERGPPGSPGFLLWHAAMRWRRAITQALEPVGLTHTQFFLLGSLRWLTRGNKAPTQAELAAHAGLDPMTTSQVVRTLVAKGWVERVDDPADSRAYALSLTPEGEVQARAGIARVKRVDAGLLDALGERAPMVLEALTTLSQRP